MTTGHVFIATSLDGYIARPDGGIDWLDVPGADEDHGYDDFISGMDGLVMGRGSFEKVLTFGDWPYDKPVVVMSRSLTEVPSGLSGKVRTSALAPVALMRQLAEEGWKRAYVDGGQVIQSFLREGLIEDMVVTRIPVLIGAGRPLFGDLARDVALKHEQTRAYPSGLVQSRYLVVR